MHILLGNVPHVREISSIRLTFLLGTEIILTQGVRVCTENNSGVQVECSGRVPFSGIHGAPEWNVLRLHRKES